MTIKTKRAVITTRTSWNECSCTHGFLDVFLHPWVFLQEFWSHHRSFPSLVLHTLGLRRFQR